MIIEIKEINRKIKSFELKIEFSDSADETNEHHIETKVIEIPSEMQEGEF